MAREHILCVDDEEGILTALRQQLGARFGDECDIELARSGADALELIEELQREGEPLAVIIADQIMPGMKGVELLETVHRISPLTTKVLLTGQAGLDAVVAAINRAGLNRYISKPWDEPDLRLTVESLLQTYRLQRQNEQLIQDLRSKNSELEAAKLSLEQNVRERTAELEKANQSLGQLAITDGLTGLYNHRYLQDQLQKTVEQSLRSGVPVAMLMVDVDHFKAYNDQLGHPAGDEALRKVARLIAQDRRQVDVVARYGGEEFAVLLYDIKRDAAVGVAEKIRRRIEDVMGAVADGQPSRPLTVSVGVAACPEDAVTAVGLLDAADAALYQAKNRGRNCVVSGITKHT